MISSPTIIKHVKPLYVNFLGDDCISSRVSTVPRDTVQSEHECGQAKLLVVPPHGFNNLGGDPLRWQ